MSNLHPLVIEARQKHQDLPILTDGGHLSYLKGWPVLYTITCFVSEKIYVGTSLNFKARYEQHFIKGEETSPLLHDSIIKFGVDNHQTRIIIVYNYAATDDEKRQARDLLEKKEEYTINKLGSRITGYGLNIIPGASIANKGTIVEGGRLFGRPSVDRNKQIL